MTDRATFDAFEQEIAGALERLVGPAVDHRTGSDVADVAMRPRGLGLRARDGSRPRRLLVLGLAAAFLLPVAYLGIVGLQPTDPDSTEDVAIFVRREEGSAPGVALVAVRPDGDEMVVRRLPDSIAPEGTWGVWGAVSRAGWIALGVENYGGPSRSESRSASSWPMILVDLRDPDAAPWVVREASLGGVGPRWGPTGLVAADGGGMSSVVIVDPETREVSRLGRAMVGGGPSIVWSADGSGLVIGRADGRYEVLPLDGGRPIPDVGEVMEPYGAYGPGMAELRVCMPGWHECSGDADGRVERVAADGSARTIWQQDGQDRALGARFGDEADEFWLTLDHDQGRQASFVRVTSDDQDAVATVARAADWMDIGPPTESADGSALVVRITREDLSSAAIIVPSDGRPSTFHPGGFAGFVDGVVAATFAGDLWTAPTTSMPSVGQAYRLPSLEKLIDAELQMNPGRRVLGKASHDAVDGDLDVRTVEVPWSGDTGEVYLDCLGPSSATIAGGGRSTTSPCLTTGAYIVSIGRGAPLTVSASGDTTWRVVVYSP
jgi:hypothetical protein